MPETPSDTDATTSSSTTPRQNLSPEAFRFYAALCIRAGNTSWRDLTGWCQIHFVRVAYELEMPPGKMFELLNELHEAGLYKNHDHVYGSVRIPPCE